MDDSESDTFERQDPSSPERKSNPAFVVQPDFVQINDDRLKEIKRVSRIV